MDKHLPVFEHEVARFQQYSKIFSSLKFKIEKPGNFPQLVPCVRIIYLINCHQSRHCTKNRKQKTELTWRGFVRSLHNRVIPFENITFLEIQGWEGMEIWSEISFDSRLICYRRNGEGFDYISWEKGELEKLVNTKFSEERYDVISRKFREIIVQFGGIWRGRVPENYGGWKFLTCRRKKNTYRFQYRGPFFVDRFSFDRAAGHVISRPSIIKFPWKLSNMDNKMVGGGIRGRVGRK